MAMCSARSNTEKHVFLQEGCKKTKMCKFYLEGKCKRGKLCTFAHCDQEVKPLPDLRCTRLCPTLLRYGECLDQSCTFAHHTAQLRTPPPVSDTSDCMNKNGKLKPSTSPLTASMPPVSLAQACPKTWLNFLPLRRVETNVQLLPQPKPMLRSDQLAELVEVQRQIEVAAAAIANLQKKLDKTEIEEPTMAKPFAWDDPDDDDDLFFENRDLSDQKYLSRQSTEDCFPNGNLSRQSTDESWIAEDALEVGASDQANSWMHETSEDTWSRVSTEESIASGDEFPEIVTKNAVAAPSATNDALPDPSIIARSFPGVLGRKIKHYVRNTFVELATEEDEVHNEDGRSVRRAASAPAAIR